MTYPSSINRYIKYFDREYESQEPGTYILYRRVDGFGNVNEVCLKDKMQLTITRIII